MAVWKLTDIAHLLETPSSSPTAHTHVTGLAYDSRRVRKGNVFVAIPGAQQDGAVFIDDAIQRGAAAIVGVPGIRTHKTPRFEVTHPRAALADLACAFAEYPARHLTMVGITGTNGKSSTAFMMQAVLEGDGRPTGLISTIRYAFGDRIIPATRTTPESLDLQVLLGQMRRAACTHVVMEVSSHALMQERTRGIAFDAAVFTNLSRDHLDYHGDMEQYFAAKKMLFTQLRTGENPGVAIVNIDDPYGARLHDTLQQQAIPCWTVGLTHAQADVRATHIQEAPDSTTCTVTSPWGTVELRVGLTGRFHLYNALSALAVGAARGITLEAIAHSLKQLTLIPGRLQPVAPAGHPFAVYVDYAHTDQALAHALEALSHIVRGNIWLVFGCGGDRDTGKRPLMGQVADRLAHHSFITSDNPRTEDPHTIAKGVADGFSHAGHYTIELDRATAITRALAAAEPGDAVLIAGKGHENTQSIGHTQVPFDDVEVARRILEEAL